jgi:plasmid stabilization system protein ParE
LIDRGEPFVPAEHRWRAVPALEPPAKGFSYKRLRVALHCDAATSQLPLLQRVRWKASAATLSSAGGKVTPERFSDARSPRARQLPQSFQKNPYQCANLVLRRTVAGGTGERSCRFSIAERRAAMPRGDKDKYTDKQKRKAEHIEESYEERGVSKKEAEARAWATVNKESGGGNKSGSGRGKKDSHESSRKGGRKGGSSQSSEDRSKAAKKGWETRRKNGNA